MIIIEFISLVVVCAVLGDPLLTLLGYLPAEEEPKRHLWIGRFAPVPFLLLAIDGAVVHSYSQAGAAVAVAVVLFLIRNRFSDKQRIQGEYARWFVFLSAVYWASGLTTSGYVAAVLFILIGFFLPRLFTMLAASAGVEETDDVPRTSNEEYSLDSAPTPASVSSPAIRRFSSQGATEELPEFEPEPTSPPPAPSPEIASRPVFQPSVAAAPAAPEHTAPPVAAKPAPTPRRRVIKPIDIITAVAEPIDSSTAEQLGISDDRQSDLIAPQETRTPPAPADASQEPAPAGSAVDPAPSAAPITSPAEPPLEAGEPLGSHPGPAASPASAATPEAPIQEPPPGQDSSRERIEREGPREAPPENDLSNFKLPTLPPRTAMPKPFEGTVDPDALKTEQPKPRTSGVSFRMNDD